MSYYCNELSALQLFVKSQFLTLIYDAQLLIVLVKYVCSGSAMTFLIAFLILVEHVLSGVNGKLVCKCALMNDGLDRLNLYISAMLSQMIVVTLVIEATPFEFYGHW